MHFIRIAYKAIHSFFDFLLCSNRGYVNIWLSSTSFKDCAGRANRLGWAVWGMALAKRAGDDWRLRLPSGRPSTAMRYCNREYHQIYESLCYHFFYLLSKIVTSRCVVLQMIIVEQFSLYILIPGDIISAGNQKRPSPVLETAVNISVYLRFVYELSEWLLIISTTTIRKFVFLARLVFVPTSTTTIFAWSGFVNAQHTAVHLRII